MPIPPDVVDLTGGGEWTRTTDLRIMSESLVADKEGDQQLSPAECGKIQQNPQAPRNLDTGIEALERSWKRAQRNLPKLPASE